MERMNNVVRERQNTANYLWQNITLTLNVFNETELKYRIGKELHLYQRKIVRAVRRGWDGGRSSRQWSFSSAFLYSLTVITTIGYGNLSPRTTWGKLATIFYTLMGMPLFLLYLSNVGELLARWFKCLYALVCLCRGCPGFSRRRVVRFRTPPVPELSEFESIERPNGWKSYPNNSEVMPEIDSLYFQGGDFKRQQNYRSYSTPHPAIHRNERSTRRLQPWSRQYDPGPSRPYPDSIHQYTYPGRLGPHSRDVDFRPGPYDPRRVYAEPVYREDSVVSSDFTYVTFDAQSITVPISVCITILVGYIIFGSMLFGTWEKWDLLDGSYFCFISLSSIGFGDFVPGERVYTQKIETSFIVCSMYLMLGMALVAMCFNLMQEQVIHYCAGFKRAMKRICRCKR